MKDYKIEGVEKAPLIVKRKCKCGCGGKCGDNCKCKKEECKDNEDETEGKASVCCSDNGENS